MKHPEVLPSELTKVGRRRPVWLYQADNLMRILDRAQLYALESGQEGVIFQGLWHPITMHRPSYRPDNAKEVPGATIGGGGARRVGVEFNTLPLKP